jgi:hypothetical protein
MLFTHQDCLILLSETILQKRKALAMVYALHKFGHYTLIIRFTFFVDHMALIYLVNKPHFSNRLTR